MDERSLKILFRRYVLDFYGLQCMPMDAMVLHGMEEVRGSILLSSTEHPRSQAWVLGASPGS
jgi:hypothetical protein